jgi:NAD(P)H-flavin reductase
MRCAVGHCGHCQLGPTLVCRDGPVYSYDRLAELMEVREL